MAHDCKSADYVFILIQERAFFPSFIFIWMYIHMIHKHNKLNFSSSQCSNLRSFSCSYWTLWWRVQGVAFSRIRIFCSLSMLWVLWEEDRMFSLYDYLIVSENSIMFLSLLAILLQPYKLRILLYRLYENWYCVNRYRHRIRYLSVPLTLIFF